MGKVLRLQFVMHYKTDLLLIALFSGFLICTNISFIPLLISILIIRQTNRKDNNLLKAFMTMPIERQHLVSSIFLYEGIVSSILFIIPGAISYFKKPVEFFTAVAITTAFIIVFNVLIAQAIADNFTANRASIKDIAMFVLPAIGFISVHVLLIAIADIKSWFFLILPVPILSFIMLHYYYKRSIDQLHLKEIV